MISRPDLQKLARKRCDVEIENESAATANLRQHARDVEERVVARRDPGRTAAEHAVRNRWHAVRLESRTPSPEA